jgi:hypothetical protein
VTLASFRKMKPDREPRTRSRCQLAVFISLFLKLGHMRLASGMACWSLAGMVAVREIASPISDAVTHLPTQLFGHQLAGLCRARSGTEPQSLRLSPFCKLRGGFADWLFHQTSHWLEWSLLARSIPAFLCPTALPFSCDQPQASSHHHTSILKLPQSLRLLCLRLKPHRPYPSHSFVWEVLFLCSTRVHCRSFSTPIPFRPSTPSRLNNTALTTLRLVNRHTNSN